MQDYLLSYGTAGDFGRFRTTTDFTVFRNDCVVVRSQRGLEMAQVLCEATPGHARFLPNTTLGKLLRVASSEDQLRALRMQERGQELYKAARSLADELSLPVEILDAEMMLDGKQAVVHFLANEEFDESELVGRLSGQFKTQVLLHTLALPREEEAAAEHGCGRPDCGKGKDGSCSTCGSGGCSSCDVAATDLKAHFAALREQMPTNFRTPLV